MMKEKALEHCTSGCSRNIAAPALSCGTGTHPKSLPIPLLFCLAAFLAMTCSFADAAAKPSSPQAKAFGKTYANHAQLWLQWAMAIPAASNPILDPDGAYAAVGQAGKVWYLAGNFGGETERSITVPSGTALFFPILNAFWNNTPEYGDAPWSPEQEEFARAAVAGLVDTTTSVALEIDGRPVPDMDSYRVASLAGSCNLPAQGNILGAELEDVPHPCVADGYWALLPPMSVGDHTIHFSGGFGSGFSLDVIYHISVRPRQQAVGAATSLLRP
jgi:hypothetical protein